MRRDAPRTRPPEYQGEIPPEVEETLPVPGLDTATKPPGFYDPSAFQDHLAFERNVLRTTRPFRGSRARAGIRELQKELGGPPGREPPPFQASLEESPPEQDGDASGLSHNGHPVSIGPRTGEQPTSFYGEERMEEDADFQRGFKRPIRPFLGTKAYQDQQALRQSVDYEQPSTPAPASQPPQPSSPPMGQSELWTTREEYESLLPPPVRQDLEELRANGVEPPFRPVPDEVLRLWAARGDDIDQAAIQWGYAKRDEYAAQGRTYGGGPAPSRADIQAEFPVDPRTGQPWAPGHEPLASLDSLAQREDDIGRRARDLLAEREARLARVEQARQGPGGGGTNAPMGGRGAGGGRTGAELVDPSLGSRPDLERLYGERPWLSGMPVDEAQAVANNRAYRQYGIRDGTFHPQQEFSLGTAAQQNEWNEYVTSSVDRMNRYMPGVLQPRIEGKSWRDRLSDGDITPEQAVPYQMAELRQRERDIVKNFGNAMSDETADALAMAVEGGDLETIRAIHTQLRRNNRLDRARNYDDMLQNRRIGQMLNSPQERQGFVYRTMASGTPEERSALAAMMGDDTVYATEMASMMPSAGGGGPAAGEAAESSDASLMREQYNQVESMLLEGNTDTAYQTLRVQFQSMYPDLPPEQHEQMASDALEDMMMQMSYGNQGPGGLNYRNDPRIIQRLRREAEAGWESWLQYTSRMGMSYRQSAEEWEALTGTRPPGASGPVSPSVSAWGGNAG